VTGVVRIAPGKRLYQFNTFPELGCLPGDVLSLTVRGFQTGGGRLEARMTVVRLESADGQWSPEDFGCDDERTFQRHGRGEFVTGVRKMARGPEQPGTITLQVETLSLETTFERKPESSSEYTNAVALVVEFANIADVGDVWLYAPMLVKDTRATTEFASGRPVPEYYTRLPITIGKLVRGEPIHILALGSSIDTGDANPRLYIYDEKTESPMYKQPLWNGQFNAEGVGRSDLEDYIGAAKQYVKYTGRMRRELMRKFDLQVSDILLNAMSCGGSSIGESHSGFGTYTALEWPPGPQNGHPRGKQWEELYPRLFADGNRPAPDLVIFGHGHNERIDAPDGIAVYEGAIRWFQKRFPRVEFLFCQWHHSYDNANIPPVPERRKLCEHYGIPFIDIVPLVETLTRHWCNYYALCPDGGHPQAGAHAIWFRQLEQMFDMADPLQPFAPQKRLPSRYNPYSYGWSGQIATYTAPHPRILGSRMIIDDTAFNLWCTDGSEEWMTIIIDGKKLERGPAGNGRQMSKRDERNSSFVHGRLSLGDRHIIEVLSGQKDKDGKEGGDEKEVKTEVEVAALDCKICDRRRFFPVDAPEWTPSDGVLPAQSFASAWGAPFGDRIVTLQPGQSLRIDIEATDLSAAYLDAADAGELHVVVDGTKLLTQPCNLPFTDTDGTQHYLENRRGIRSLEFGNHTVELRAANAPVSVLGLFTYDSR
jgi:hypothetical protein